MSKWKDVTGDRKFTQAEKKVAQARAKMAEAILRQMLENEDDLSYMGGGAMRSSDQRRRDKNARKDNEYIDKVESGQEDPGPNPRFGRDQNGIMRYMFARPKVRPSKPVRGSKATRKAKKP
jgi:hypothetical protein